MTVKELKSIIEHFDDSLLVYVDDRVHEEYCDLVFNAEETADHSHAIVFVVVPDPT